MSLFQTIIDEIKADLKHDLQLLEEELLILRSEILDFDNKKYKSDNVSYIYENKQVAIAGSLNLINDEMKMLDESFTEDMIKDLDYFMEKNNKAHPNANAFRIIRARLDIVRFYKAKISLKDFNRDFEAISNSIKNLRRHITLTPPLLILKKPSDVIKDLIFDINHQDAYIYGYEDYAEKIRLSDTALKELMDILTEGDRKRMPRTEDDFIEKHSEYLYGKK